MTRHAGGMSIRVCSTRTCSYFGRNKWLIVTNPWPFFPLLSFRRSSRIFSLSLASPFVHAALSSLHLSFVIIVIKQMLLLLHLQRVLPWLMPVPSNLTDQHDDDEAESRRYTHKGKTFYEQGELPLRCKLRDTRRSFH